MLNKWLIQLVLLVLFGLLMMILEKSAAMRGAKGQPMPTWFDITLRVIFLSIIAYPFVAMDWRFALPFLLYLPSYVSLAELHGGRPEFNAWIRGSFIWRVLAWYFKLDLVKTVELDPKKAYIFGLHPHGILPFGTITNMVTDASGFAEKFPGLQIRGLAASFCFYLPIYRDLVLAGMVCDAARYSAHRLLEKKLSLFLVPGGATEALYASPDEDVLVLKKRLGFVRLALQHGVSLVPVFSFNENNTFSQLATSNPTVSKIKRKFQAIFGISLPLITNIIPRRAQITTVIGGPIPVPKIAEPTDDDVRKYLDIYIQKLEQLYRENGPKYNHPPTKKLIVN
eukprot:comp15554_c0_seq1/m.23808 comp15554_c0_seq1/g.23808  ORF comp15554_c0_seq1/g.23808 comp15554_c0_seq1/m.23808 type:complete len:339 (-) comp15554_c0_seq1:66-1082(-)